MWPSGHSTINQVFIICEAFTSNVLHSLKQEKSVGDRSGLYGGCSKLSQWNCSRSKACVCRAVCGRALSCNRTIPRESLPLRQNNPRSHRPAETNDTPHLSAGGTLNRHSHGHSYLCTYHVIRPDVQLLETIFNITLNNRNQQNRCAGCNAQKFFTFWMACLYTLAVQ